MANLAYVNSNPDAIVISDASTGPTGRFLGVGKNQDIGGLTHTRIYAYAVLSAGTYYIWAKARASASNNIVVESYQIEP